MRVMNNLTGQKDFSAGKLPDGFIGIFDGTLHSVAKAELHCEQECQVAQDKPKTVRAHDVDDLAAIVFKELRPNLGPQSEAFLIIGLRHPFEVLVLQTSAIVSCGGLC